MVSIMPYVFTYTVIRYTPCWLYTSFHTDWGPGESSRRAVEDKNTLIRPHAAPVPCYYKSQVSSKCSPLHQESNHPTLQSLIQLYGLCASNIPLLWPKHMAKNILHCPAPLNCFSPKLFLILLLSLSISFFLLQWIEADSVSLLLIFYITSLHAFM